MGINVRLEEFTGETVEEILDPTNLIKSLLSSIYDPPFQCLGVVDPYGDTVFNYLQMDKFLSELMMLKAAATSDEERMIIGRIEALAIRCRDERFLLRFVGD